MYSNIFQKPYIIFSLDMQRILHQFVHVILIIHEKKKKNSWKTHPNVEVSQHKDWRMLSLLTIGFSTWAQFSKSLYCCVSDNWNGEYNLANTVHLGTTEFMTTFPKTSFLIN